MKKKQIKEHKNREFEYLSNPVFCSQKTQEQQEILKQLPKNGTPIARELALHGYCVLAWEEGGILKVSGILGETIGILDPTKLNIEYRE